MLLQRLRDFSDRLDLPPNLYSEVPVRYIIELNKEGQLLSDFLTDTADPSSPATHRGQRRPVPQIQRSSGVKPLLLADKADYVLGFSHESGRSSRVAQCHAAFLDLLGRCAAATEEPAVITVQRFLASEPLAQLKLDEGFDPGATITFRVDGAFPIDLPAVQAFWAAENDPSLKDAPVMQCLVCGRERPVLDRLQAKIKGVPGGQTSGTSLISANAEAFESYGLEASLTAPTCAECGERFTKAANGLLADEQSRIILGGTAFIFWTREDVGFDFRGAVVEADPEKVKLLIESVRSGRKAPNVDEAQFYATVLSGSGGRTVVRDWIDTTVGEVKRYAARWFERQEIVSPYGDEPRYFGIAALAYATVRDRNELPPTTPRALLHSALTGRRLPPSLLYQAVRRAQAGSRLDRGERVTWERAALIKLVLSDDEQEREHFMPGLNVDNPNPAYHCGRLLAVLEELQQRALGNVNASIVDKFLATAASAPATVFGNLLQGSVAHLSKLKGANPGASRAIQERIESVVEKLDSFPLVLTPKDQAVFALGYYHQRANDRAAARAAAQRRQSQDQSEQSPV